VGLLLPLSWDNWVYQTMGWDLAAYSKLPYVGSWDVNFPGIIYIHAVVIALFGTSDLAFRIFDAVIQTATCWIFFTLLSQWLKPLIALLASLIYPLLYVSLTWSVAGQRDAFIPILLFSGLLLLFKSIGSSRPRYSFIAGFLIASCAIIRPTYGLFSLSVIVSYLISYKRFDSFNRSFVLGCLLAFVGLLLPFALATNGLRDFYIFTIRFNLDIYSHFKRQASFFFNALQVTGQLVAFFTALGIVSILIRRNRTITTSPLKSFDKLLFSFLIVSALLSIFVMCTFQADHYLPFLALLSPIMALGIALPFAILPKRYAIILAAILGLYFCYRLYPRNLIRQVLDAKKMDQPILHYTYTQMDGDSLTGYNAEAMAVNYLKASTSEYDLVEVLCYNRPYLRVKAKRVSATRFTELLPLAMKTSQGTFTDYQLGWRTEFVDQLNFVKPKFIVFADNGFRIYVPQSPFDATNEIPGFTQLLNSSYHHDTTIRGFTFFKRNL